MPKTTRVNRSAVTQPNKPTVREIIARVKDSVDMFRDGYRHPRTGRIEDSEARRAIACLRAGIKLLRGCR